MKNNSETKKKLILLVTLLFIYVLLFEFILPINKVLPKPSLLIETFFSIWPVYHFARAFAISTTIVYVSLLIGFVTIIFKSRYIIMFSYEFPELVESLKLFKYFPPFFIAILFAFWFGNSIYAELMFGYLIAVFMLGNKLFVESKNVKEEYIYAASSLGLSSWKIYSKIMWKAVEPEIFDELKHIHYSLWVMVLIYEFVAGIPGLGGLYDSALLYNDYSALIVFAIFISVVICIGNFILKILKNKLYQWEQ